MAKKKSGNGKRQEESIAVPEGFTINAGAERGEGWIVKEEGVEVLGRLLGRRTYLTKRGKTRAFYQLQLHKPSKCQVPNPDFNEEAEESDDNQEFLTQMLPTDSIVNVDEFKKLEDMKPFTVDGGVYDVWFIMGGKVDIGDDQTMWTLLAGPKLKMVKPPGSQGRESSGRYQEKGF